MCTQSKGVHVQIVQLGPSLFHKLFFSDNWIGPELKQLRLHHLQVPIVQQSDYHVVVRQHLSNPGPVPIPLILLYILADGSPRSLYLPFANFDSFNSTCVLPNIWAEQSLSTSLMSYGDGSKHSDHYFCRCQSNIVTTILLFLEKNEKKNEKCLELPDFARKLIRKNFPNIATPPP